MKILITGFDPFGGESCNPSSLALRQLKAPDGVELIKLTEIPTVFSVGAQIFDAVLREKPRAVVCVGQAGGRRAITPERVAINLMDATICDNRGFCPKDLPVVPGGPAAYFTTLPLKAMVSSIRDAGIPAEISNSAGTFVCNSLIYSLLHLIEENQLPTRAGFLHLPFLPSQAESRPGYPSMTLSQMVRGLEAALEAIRDDIS